MRARTIAGIVLLGAAAAAPVAWGWIVNTPRFGSGVWPAGVARWAHNPAGAPANPGAAAALAAITAAAQTWNDDRGSNVNLTATPLPKLVTAGPNGVANSAAAGDDVQIVAVGQGRPNAVVVDTGADGIANTAAGGDDVQLIPVGQGDPNQICVIDGGNGVANSPPGGDDVAAVVAGIPFVHTGPDGICNTAAVADDAQVIPVGRGRPNRAAVNAGPDGLANTAAAGDDAQVVPVGQGQPGALVVGPGPDSVLQTVPGGDDVLVDPLCGNNADGANTVGWAPTGVLASTQIRTSAADPSRLVEFDVCIENGPQLCVVDGGDGMLPARVGDDGLGVLDNGRPVITTGPDMVCDTAGAVPPGGDDLQVVPAGQAFWSTTLPVPAGGMDLQTVMLHEFGHGIGLNHADGDAVPLTPPNAVRPPPTRYAKVVMFFAAAHSLAKRSLLCDDKSGANFLYPPPGVPTEARTYRAQNSGGCDLGDAPDPQGGVVGRYPSLENGEDFNANGVLDADRRGTFTGFFRPAPAFPDMTEADFDWNANGVLDGEDMNGNGVLDLGNGARHKDGRMEWLGPIAAAAGVTLPGTPAPTFEAKNEIVVAPPGVVIGQTSASAAAATPASATFEPEMLRTDELDDGVSLRGPLVPRVVGAVPVLVDILVNTTNVAGRYAADQLYVNGWEDWNADADWDDWTTDDAAPGGPPPCTPAPPGSEYVLNWRGTLAADVGFSKSFCGSTLLPGGRGKVLTFVVAAPPLGGFGPRPPGQFSLSRFHQRFRVDYGENVGRVLKPFSDLSLVKSAAQPVTFADLALGRGFARGEAKYGEVEDYDYCFRIAKRLFKLKDLGRILGGVSGVSDLLRKLRLGRNAFAGMGTWLVAPQVILGNAASVSGVAADIVRTAAGAIIRGGSIAPPSFPLLDPFPAAPAVVAGIAGFVVPAGATVTLPPGVYGLVRVQDGARLELVGGASYVFDALIAGRNAVVAFTGAAPWTLDVARTIRVGVGSLLGPEHGDDLPTINVAGQRVMATHETSFAANLNAPEAKLSLGRNATYVGSFLVDALTTDHSCTLACTDP